MDSTYTVKKGDTLYGISNQFGVSVTELAELNNIRGSNLQIGQVLKIPSNTGTNPNNMFIYTVQKGDSLYSIATKYKTTVKAIQNLNYLKTINLSVGQKLRIPETYSEANAAPNYTNYIVQKGDTLYSIARKNNVNVDTLMKDNALTNTSLKLGQTLRIRVPSTISYESIEECIGPSYIPPIAIETTTYTVKKGDNLYNIARQFGVSETAIKNLNNLTTNNLSIGQILKIPKTSSNNTYVVQKGDSLYSVARKFNTTVDSIKNKNNLKTNTLSIGQRLII